MARRVVKRRIEDSGLLAFPAGGRADMAAGLDEAGRGCLAGPVVAAAVLFPEGFDLLGLDDSKVLDEAERARLATEIRALAPGWGIGLAWMNEIERHNILQASLLAMARALAALRRRIGAAPDALAPARLLIDGNQLIPPLYFRLCRVPQPEQRAIVDGDALIPAISAASVLAKTFRDDLMIRLDRRWPGYGFARHKGYGTREHREALARLGPCPLHRRDFKGVRPEQAQGLLC